MRPLQRDEIARDHGLALRVQQLLKRIQCPFTGSGLRSGSG
jgi:hypothetical protein